MSNKTDADLHDLSEKVADLMRRIEQENLARCTFHAWRFSPIRNVCSAFAVFVTALIFLTIARDEYTLTHALAITLAFYISGLAFQLIERKWCQRKAFKLR